MPRIPEEPLAPADAVARAGELLAAGMPFAAHEVLEGAWKATTGAERPLWQGLAQLAVGLTHAQRGNAAGAVSLLRRGAEGIDPFVADPPHHLDLPGLVAHARALAGRIEQDGLDAVAASDLTPRLSAPDR